MCLIFLCVAVCVCVCVCVCERERESEKERDSPVNIHIDGLKNLLQEVAHISVGFKTIVEASI